MASRWPRLGDDSQQHTSLWGGFEREGDKMYLAAEVLRGHYGKETDIFRWVLGSCDMCRDQVLMVALCAALG